MKRVETRKKTEETRRNKQKLKKQVETKKTRETIRK